MNPITFTSLILLLFVLAISALSMDLLGIDYTSVALLSKLDAPDVNCQWDSGKSAYLITLDQSCWTVSTVLGVVTLGIITLPDHCAKFEAPRVKCDFIPHYKASALTTTPTQNFDCSTLSPSQLSSFTVCHNSWVPPVDNIWLQVQYTLLPSSSTGVLSVSNLDLVGNRIAALATQTWKRSGFTQLLDSVIPAASCSPCTGVDCDYLFANCPANQFTLQCEDQVNGGMVLCPSSLSVKKSTQTCPTDGKYRRTQQIPSSCSVAQPNGYQHTFIQSARSTSCDQASLTALTDPDLASAVIVSVAELDVCPGLTDFSYELYCGTEYCPLSPAQLCTNQCTTRSQVAANAAVRCKYNSFQNQNTFESIAIGDVDPSSVDPHQVQCLILFTERGYLAWVSEPDAYCTIGCSVAFACLVSPSLGSLSPAGPCTAETLRGFLGQDSTTTCSDSSSITVPSDRVVVKVTDSLGITVVPRKVLSVALQSPTTLSLLTALNAQTGPSLQLPAYNGCGSARILCQDNYNPQGAPTEEKCSQLQGLAAADEITRFLGAPVYSSPSFQCSKKCDVGEYRLKQYCQYVDTTNPSTQLKIFPIESSQCFTAFASKKLSPLSTTAVKCLEVNSTCPPQPKCTLGGTIISSEAACTTSFCPMTISSPFCSPQEAPVTLPGSREIDGCFFNGIKLRQDTPCTGIGAIPLTFTCPLPTCIATSVPTVPTMPATLDLVIMQYNTATGAYNRVKQQGETVTGSDDDVDGISMGSIFQLQWNYASETEAVGYIEANFDNFSFPVPIAAVSMRANAHTVNLQNNVAFQRLKWGTADAVDALRTVQLSLRVLKAKYTTKLVNLFSLCNQSQHISPLQCTNSEIQPTQGQCNGLLQRCDCYNAFYGTNCAQQMCQVYPVSSSFSYTTECGQNGPGFNECSIENNVTNTPFESNPDSNTLSSTLHTTCSCNDSTLGPNCNALASCTKSSHESCHSHGLVESTFNWISSTVDLVEDDSLGNEQITSVTDIEANPQCDSLCTCNSSFRSPLDNCASLTFSCNDKGTIVNDESCSCNADSYGQYCQCSLLGSLSLALAFEPANYDVVATSWHQSLLKDIQSDTGLNPKRFVFVSDQTVVNQTDPTLSSWIIKYNVMDCLEDDYSGIALYPGQADLFSEVSMFVTSSALDSQFVPLFSAHSTTPMDPLTSVLFNQLAEPTTFDEMSSSWNDLANLPPARKPTTATHTGPASEAAGGLSSTPSPVIDPVDPVDPEPETKSTTKTLLIVLLVVIIPCVVFIALLIVLCVCAKKKVCCWSPEFKKKQEMEMNTYQDESGKVVAAPQTTPGRTSQTETSVTQGTTTSTRSATAETISASSPAASGRHLGRQGRSNNTERSECETNCQNYNRSRDPSQVSNATETQHSNRSSRQPVDFDFGGSQRGTIDSLGNPSASRPVSEADSTSNRRGSALPFLVLSEDGQALPPGWAYVTNGERPYYYNSSTMQTSWIHPDKMDNGNIFGGPDEFN